MRIADAKKRIALLAVFALLPLNACAPILPADTTQAGALPQVAAVQIASDDYFLRAAAVRMFKTNGVAVTDKAADVTDALPLANALPQAADALPQAAQAASSLRLREAIREELESVAADGSVGSYRIDYELFYLLGDSSEKIVSRSEVIDHNANAYWASEKQRRQAVDTLRIDALTQMFYTLEL